MADTVLMNLIIAVISFGRRDASLKRRKRVGEESRASLSVAALETCLHHWEQRGCKQTLPVTHLHPCDALDADTVLNIHVHRGSRTTSASAEGQVNPRLSAVSHNSETTARRRKELSSGTDGQGHDHQLDGLF